MTNFVPLRNKTPVFAVSIVPQRVTYIDSPSVATSPEPPNEEIQREVETSLAMYGGAGAAEAAQRQRIEQAANDADRAMQAEIARLSA